MFEINTVIGMNYYGWKEHTSYVGLNLIVNHFASSVVGSV